MDGATRLNLPESYLKKSLSEYGKSHQSPTNRWIHKVCVPAILFSLIGLLQCIPGPIPFDAIFLLGSFLFYIRFRSFKVYGIVLLQLVPILYVLSTLGSDQFYVCLTVFVFAWVGQFFGHHIEGKKPSFTEDLRYLWIGPIWIFLS